MAKRKGLVVNTAAGYTGVGPFAPGEIIDADDPRVKANRAKWIDRNQSLIPAQDEDYAAAGVSKEEWELAQAQAEVLDLDPAATPALTTGDLKTSEYDFQAAEAASADAAPGGPDSEERKALQEANLLGPDAEGESTLPQDNKKARGK